MRWLHLPAPPDRVRELGRALDASPVVAEMLIRLGFEDPDPARRFLEPKLADLADPFDVHQVDEAVDRLLRAIEKREDVAILGDYDVDGVSSTALLTAILRRFGLRPRYYVPRRLEEGYGLSLSSIDRVVEESGSPDLFISLDCGTNSVEEAARLRGLGVDVIIVDHHRGKGPLPDDCILINPHVHAEGSAVPWQHLCTVGLVFKLVHGLVKRLRERGDKTAAGIQLREYLDFVALGTLADLVPLTGENRILVCHGMRILRRTRHPGLASLLEVCGLGAGHPLSPPDIAFRLGPRINASGRLADAGLSVDLFLGEDPVFCLDAARQLDRFNRERQDIEREIAAQADEIVARDYPDARGLVLFDESWHPGVVGIVAARVCRQYNRPSIVLGSEGDMAKGSGRGIPGMNLVKVLGECGDHLESWGGHPLAVGVSLPARNVEAFREAFDRAIRETVIEPVEPELEITAWIRLDGIRESLMREIDRMQPFGQGNPEPVFGLSGVVIRDPVDVFHGQHFRFRIENSAGRRLFGVAWKMADRPLPSGTPVDCAIRLNWNFFNGKRHLQLELIDWRPSEA